MNEIEAQKKVVESLTTSFHAKYKDGLKDVLLLSGGIDSLMVLALYDSLYGASGLKTYTFVGEGLKEQENSRMFAELFNTEHTEVEIDVNDLMSRMDLVKNTNYETVFQAMFRILSEITTEKVPMSGWNVLHGGGADTIQSSQSPFLFTATKQIQTKYKLSYEDAQDWLRKDDYKKKMAKEVTDKAPGYIRKQAYESAGANIVDIFNDPAHSWMVDLPITIMRSKTKGLFKDVLKYEFGVEGIEKIKRQDMQMGTGLYHQFREELEKKFGETDANVVIKNFCKKRNKLNLMMEQ